MKWKALLIVAALATTALPATADVQDGGTIELKLRQGLFLTQPGISHPVLVSLAYDGDRNSRRGTALDWCMRTDDRGRPVPCREISIDVKDPSAWRLRVAFETPGTARPIVDAELWGPEGSDVPEPSRRKGPGKSQHSRSVFDSAEVYYYEPPAGRWTLRIIPVVADPSNLMEIRIRAKLEARPNPSDAQQLLTPNLRPELMYGFSLANNLRPRHNCDAGDTDSPATNPDYNWRCLRFGFGFQNVGLGPYELRIDTSDPSRTQFPATQVIFRPRARDGGPDTTPETYADNDRVTYPAGTATWHAAHGHFHYDDIVYAQLYRVAAPGVLVADRPAEKRGNCAHDWVLAGFDKFRDAKGQADSGDDCSSFATDTPAESMRIGLSAGWSDIYVASLPDNYVPFPAAPGGVGEWVLQLRIDYNPDRPGGQIRETDETDNVGYAHFRVDCASSDCMQQQIVILERGRGTDPWDLNREILTEFGQ